MGPLLTLAAAGVVELVERFLVHVPNLGVVVLVAAAYAAYLGGFRAGLASSLVAVLYSAWTLSEPGAVFHYAPESAVRLAVLLAATPGTALLVGVLRDRMGELIDDLLKLSRVARSPVRLQEVDLSALVARIGAELRQRAAGRAVELRVQPGVVARADPKLLAVALENLLDNAWKFTAPRRQALVEFGVVQAEAGLACFVRDNGVGFDMRYADKLFAPFQRLHKPSEFPGTGIGLATVQRVVARHGGKVWAQAQVDGGATFYFTLPGLEVRGAAEADPAGGGQPR